MPLTSWSFSASAGALREQSGLRKCAGPVGIFRTETRQGCARGAVPWATFLQAFLVTHAHAYMYTCVQTHIHTHVHTSHNGWRSCHPHRSSSCYPPVPTSGKQRKENKREYLRIREKEKEETEGEQRRVGEGILDTVRKDRSDQTSLGNEGAENDLFKKPNKKPGLLGNPEGVQGQGWSLGSQRQPDSPASRAFI